jgi:hypothetical protein
MCPQAFLAFEYKAEKGAYLVPTSTCQRGAEDGLILALEIRWLTEIKNQTDKFSSTSAHDERFAFGLSASKRKIRRQ